MLEEIITNDKIKFNDLEKIIFNKKNKVLDKVWKNI